MNKLIRQLLVVKNKILALDKQILNHADIKDKDKFSQINTFLKNLEDALSLTVNKLKNENNNFLLDELVFIDDMCPNDKKIDKDRVSLLKDFENKQQIMLLIFQNLSNQLSGINLLLADANLGQYFTKLAKYIQDILTIINQVFLLQLEKLLTMYSQD
jgi:hypothetical protein